MFTLYEMDSGWYGIRIPKADTKYIATDVAQFQLELKQGLFLIDVMSDAVRKATDSSGDSVVVLHDSHKVKFSVANDPSKNMILPVDKLIATLQQTVDIQRTSSPSDRTEQDEFSKLYQDKDFRVFIDTVKDLKIEGKYPPMRHQLIAGYFKSHNRRAFDLSTMRTGKTGSTMIALEYLFRTQQIDKALILAPLSCVRPVWLDALSATVKRNVSAVTGTRAARVKELKKNPQVVVTNYECVKLLLDDLEKWGQAGFVGKPRLAVVVDEVTAYANLTSQRTKAMRRFISDLNPDYVIGMTGTPGHDPLKAFGMSKTINPNAVTVKTMTAWRDLTQYRWGTEAWQWKNRECAPAMIKQALSPAVLFKKDDLFDLPPVVYSAREVEQSSQQKKLMNQLKSDMIAFAESGERITAQQKSVLVSKLLQCACGAVYADGSTTIDVDTNDRAQEISELINESSYKTVIFSAFTGALRKRCQELTDLGHKCAIVDGSTTEKQRSEIFHKFLHDPKGQSIDVLIAHPRTTAFGVELASADTMIFDGAPLSGDFVFGQAVERLSSLKQKAKQINIVQVYSCTEERKVFKALLDGQSESAAVADLFKSVTGV